MERNVRHTLHASYLGYVTQAIVNNLSPLLFLIFRDAFAIPLGQITLLVTINFCVQLTVDFLAANIADRIGYRPCIVAAHILSAIGIAGLAFFPVILPPFSGLFLSVFLYAIGGGLIEVLVSPIAEACPTDHKAAVMSLLHSFYCWGALAVILLTTLALQVFGKEIWQWLCLAWATLPAANAIFFSRVPLFPLVEQAESMRMGELFRSGAFWVFALLILCSGASEHAVSQWASAFAENSLGVNKTIGDLLGPCFFALMMGTSRVLYAKFGKKVDLSLFLTGSGFLCVLSYLTIVFSPWPILSLIGCGLVGFSVGILWPGVFSLAAKDLPRGGTALFAFLALAGDLGCGSGPTLAGFVSSAFGDNLTLGILSAVVFPVVLTVLSAVLWRRRKQKRL